MKTILLFFLLITAALHADTLMEKVAEGNVSTLTEKIKMAPQVETEEQRRLRILTEQPDKPIEGVAVELFKVDVDKNASIGVEYAPELKQGDIIDNKEQTTIKFKYKF